MLKFKLKKKNQTQLEEMNTLKFKRSRLTDWFTPLLFFLVFLRFIGCCPYYWNHSRGLSAKRSVLLTLWSVCVVLTVGIMAVLALYHSQDGQRKSSVTETSLFIMNWASYFTCPVFVMYLGSVSYRLAEILRLMTIKV